MPAASKALALVSGANSVENQSRMGRFIALAETRRHQPGQEVPHLSRMHVKVGDARTTLPLVFCQSNGAFVACMFVGWQ